MRVVTSIDPSGFLEMLQGLQDLSGQTFEHLLIDQVGALLRNCIAHTRAAGQGAIIKRVSRRNNFIEFASGEVISVWKKAGGPTMFLDTSTFKPRKGQRAPLLERGLSWHEMEPGSGGSGNGRHWSDARWSKFEMLKAEAAKRQQDFQKALQARGLAKHSWLQAALDLGISTERVGAAGYVQAARPSNGAEYKNGFARTLLEGAAIYIEVSNDQPILVDKLNGAGILQGALDSRVKAFDIETKKGVFADLEARAKRYPGIFTNS